jgi:hypothetical protein
MKLSDALTQLRGTSDQTHKFWAYYQAFTAAAIGFAWASTKPPWQLIVGLAAAYSIFAIFNGRLVMVSQTAALKTWQAIQAYRANPSEPIAPEFSPLLELNEPDAPGVICAMHVALSVAASLAILASLCFRA